MTRETKTEICESTNIRTEACACRACARGKTPAAKFAANRRDVLALLDLIAGCVENHPRHTAEKPVWGHVGDIAYLRDRLREIAVSLAVGANGSETDAQRRIEMALGEDDEHVGEALIEAM